jgi:hypothetical protein
MSIATSSSKVSETEVLGALQSMGVDIRLPIVKRTSKSVSNVHTNTESAVRATVVILQDIKSDSELRKLEKTMSEHEEMSIGEVVKRELDDEEMNIIKHMSARMGGGFQLSRAVLDKNILDQTSTCSIC